MRYSYSIISQKQNYYINEIVLLIAFSENFN